MTRATTSNTAAARIRRAGIAAMGAAALMTACAGTPIADPGSLPDGPVDVQTVAALQPFSACDELLNYVKQAALERVGPYGFNGDTMMKRSTGGVDDAAGQSAQSNTASDAAPTAPESASATASDASGGSAAVTHSETNNQEAGVDEPDQVKTDGRHLLTLNDNRLVIVDVSGPAPTLAGTLALPGLDNASMFLDGDRVLLIAPENQGDGIQPMTTPSIGGPRAGSSYGASSGTWLRLIDIADATQPRIIDSVHLDGAYVDARATTGSGSGDQTRARVVVTAAPGALPFVYPSGSDDASRQQATETNRSIIERSTIESWMPQMQRGEPGSDGRPTGPTAPLLDCAAVRHPATFSGFDTLAVLTVALGGSSIDPRDGTGILADGQTVYASTDNLYVATPVTQEQQPPVVPGTVPPATSAPTTTTSSPTTSSTSTSSSTTSSSTTSTSPGTTAGTTPGTAVAMPAPGGTPVPSPPIPAPRWSEPNTAIHRFAINGPGPAQYSASGLVRGTLLNQFAMSEDKGTLRVATTRGAQSGGIDSAVTTLAVAGNELKIIGEVGNIGHGEQIKSVRFLGNRGYVVTFRQTDPLFVIDLTNPTAPTVAGELKILGYSAYLHPAGENLLIGVGQDATERGRTLGTKVVLFDVSDPANPREVADHVLTGANSQAEADHHAFLWWPATNLALLPVTQQRYAPSCPPGAMCTQQGGTTGFDGALGLTITGGGITEAGRIVSPWRGWTTGADGPSCPDDACSFPFTTPIDRLVVVGDRVLSISSAGIGTSDLATLRPGAWLSL